MSHIYVGAICNIYVVLVRVPFTLILVEVQTNAGYKYMRHMRNNQCLNLTVVHSSKMSKKFQKRVVLFPTSPRDE